MEDDEYVSQLTERSGTFRSQPRLGYETDFSVHRGRMELAEFYSAVTRDYTPLPEDLERNGARYAQAGALRAAGFEVVHTPGRITSGTHVSIVWVDGDPEEAVVPWPDEVSSALEACFNETRRQDDEADDVGRNRETGMPAVAAEPVRD